jgi:hypothetical protein
MNLVCLTTISEVLVVVNVKGGCKMETFEEQDKRTYRTRPIYGTNFDKPISELIEDIRSILVQARGKLADLKYGLGHKDRFQPAEGGITCIISHLYNVANEFRELERNQKMIEEGKERL